MTGEIAAIEFEAEARQVKTMADGTVNVILNVPEYCIEQVKVILGWRGSQVRIVMERVSESLEDNQNGKTKTHKRTAHNPLKLVGR